LEVAEFAPRARKSQPSTESQPTPLPTSPPNYSALDVTVAAFTGLGYALSSRAILLLVLVGAFVLALFAVSNPRLEVLAVLVAYCLFTVVPVTFLEIKRRAP
jgi:hypothetical protein